MIQFAILHSSMMYICVILVNYVNFTGIKASTVWVCQCCASQWPGSRGRSASLESCNLHKGTSIRTCQALVFLLGIESHKSDTIATPKIKQMSQWLTATSIHVQPNTIYIQQIVHVIWDQVDKIHTCKISTEDAMSRQTCKTFKFFKLFPCIPSQFSEHHCHLIASHPFPITQTAPL